MVKFNRKIGAPIIVFTLLLSVIVPFFSFSVPFASAANPSKATIISDMKSWCDANDAITSYESIGKTYENNDIWQFKIGTNDSYKIMMDGALHGMEGGGAMLCYYFAQWLLSGNTTANYFLANAQFIITPIINYDRCSLPSVGDATYRKNANGSYPLGTDLNRNFVNGWSYSSDTTSNYYSGGTAASQNETKAIRAEFTDEQPDIYINYHDFGGKDGYHGWMLFYAGNESYRDRANAIFGTYDAICSSLGMTTAYQTFQGGFGSAKDDCYTLTNQNCISVNWEITGPDDSPWGATLISTVKLQQLIVFSTAIVNNLNAGADPDPPVLYDSFEDSWSPLWTAAFNSTDSEGTIATGTSNPHHGTHSLSATIDGAHTDKYACVYKTISGLAAAPIYIRAMNVNFGNQPITEGYAMHCFAATQGTPSGLSAFAYFGILKNATHWNYYIRAIYTATTFQNYVSTVQPSANDTVEAVFYRGTSSDGYAYLYVNDVLVVNASALDNDARTLNYLHAGAVFSDAAGTPSTITMDCVEINTHYIGPEVEPEPDLGIPTYSGLAYSGTMAGRVCTFSVTLEDDEALNNSILSLDNGNGYFTNVTSTFPEGNPATDTFQVTLNSTVGKTVNAKWYFSDLEGNWNTTSTLSFTTTRMNQTDDFLKWANVKRVDTDFADYLSGSTFDFDGYYANLYTKFVSELETTQYGPTYTNRTVDYGSASYSVGDTGIDWSAIADYTCDTLAEAQTAFTNCASGDIIYLVGHIPVTTRLTMTGKSNIMIVGDGWNSTSLDLADNINTQTVLLSGCTNIVMVDLTVCGNRIHNIDVGSMGALAVDDGTNCTVENVRVVGGRRDGIYMSDGLGMYIVNSVGDDAGWNGIALSRCNYSAIVGSYGVDCSDVNVNIWAGNNQVLANSVSGNMVRQGIGAEDSAWGFGLEVQDGMDLYNIIVRQCLSTGNSANISGYYGDGFVLGDGKVGSDSYNIIFDNNNASYNYHCGIKIGIPTTRTADNATIVVINNQLHDNDMAHRDVSYVDDFVTYRDNITTELISSVFGFLHGIPIDEWKSYRGIPIEEIKIRGIPES